MTHGQTRVQQHRGHQADAVLAAGILTDATALWTLIERLRAAGHGTSVYESAAEVGDMIAAALSPAQSERAEVES